MSEKPFINDVRKRIEHGVAVAVEAIDCISPLVPRNIRVLKLKLSFNLSRIQEIYDFLELRADIIGHENAALSQEQVGFENFLRGIRNASQGYDFPIHVDVVSSTPNLINLTIRKPCYG